MKIINCWYSFQTESNNLFRLWRKWFSAKNNNSLWWSSSKTFSATNTKYEKIELYLSQNHSAQQIFSSRSGENAFLPLAKIIFDFDFLPLAEKDFLFSNKKKHKFCNKFSSLFLQNHLPKSNIPFWKKANLICAKSWNCFCQFTLTLCSFLTQLLLTFIWFYFCQWKKTDLLPKTLPDATFQFPAEEILF